MKRLEQRIAQLETAQRQAAAPIEFRLRFVNPDGTTARVCRLTAEGLVDMDAKEAGDDRA